MTRHTPLLALLLGAAGLVPFVALGLGALMLAPDAALRSLLALVGYGAVILAFLGGVHWGFALGGSLDQDSGALSARLGLGVLPSLIGWTALAAAFFGLPLVGVAMLLAGFIGTVAVESRAARAGLMPPGYMGLRWALTAVVVLSLACVLVARLFGIGIII